MKGRTMSRRRMSYALRLSPLCLAVALTTRGASEDGELQQWMQQAHWSVSTTVPPLPEPKSYAPREYTTAKQTDSSSVQKAVGLSHAQDKSPEPNRRCEPSEDYPSEAFRLIGTMRHNGETEVVMFAGDKTQHMHMGQYIG